MTLSVSKKADHVWSENQHSIAEDLRHTAFNIMKPDFRPILTIQLQLIERLEGLARVIPLAVWYLQRYQLEILGLPSLHLKITHNKILLYLPKIIYLANSNANLVTDDILPLLSVE